MDRTWENIDRSQTHGMEIGTEAMQFLVWEYINQNFFAVQERNFCYIFTNWLGVVDGIMSRK